MSHHGTDLTNPRAKHPAAYAVEMRGPVHRLEAQTPEEMARLSTEHIASVEEAGTQQGPYRPQKPNPSDRPESSATKYYAPSPHAPGERTLAEIEADLAKPLVERLIEWKPKNAKSGGKVWLPFIGWETVMKLLTYKAPGWADFYEVTMSADRVATVCRLCIPTADQGVVCRSATGDDDEEDGGYGTPLDRASARALVRAAGKFFLGFYLRDDDLRPKPPANLAGR